MPHDRLFIPGPVEVHPEILSALATPQIGHRHPAFGELYKAIQPKLQAVLETRNPVLLFTASATGVWEACARNLVGRGCLHLVNGAFSERWEEVTRLNGKATGVLTVPWGRAHRDLDLLRAELATGRYDALAVVHSETSTGVLEPLAAIAGVARAFPDVLLLVDAVSSLSTLPIPTDDLGIDVLLAGVQKGFGLPPGLAVASVSERAFARAETIPHRGYYFDLIEMRRFHDKAQTPSTPSIPHLYALRRQLERMLAEGLTARYARHRALAERCRAWARARGFAIFAEEGCETFGLTCIENRRGIDVDALARWLQREHHLVLDQGYGKIKGKTFRIAHMGDTTSHDLEVLLAAIDDWLERSEEATPARSAGVIAPRGPAGAGA